MSSATISKDSKLYSTDEVTPILNTADFWLDMSDSTKFTTSSTTRINTITDKSATPKTITNTGNISYDTIRKGIKPTGTAGTDYLTINLASPATGTVVSETVFVVGYTSNTGTSAFLGGTASGTRSYYVSGTGLIYGAYGGTNITASVTIPTETVFVGCAQLTSSTNVNLYYNGRYITSGNPAGFSASSTTQNIFRAGGVTNYWLRGAVYEMLIFQTALTTSQINVVNHYLMNKWKVVTTTTSLISSPLSITSSPCTLWLDGNDSSTITYGTGTKVSQWADKSGNGYHATQSTSANQPTYDSTLKGVLFNGTNSTYFLTTAPFSPTETIFIVANVSTSTTSWVILGTTNSGYGRHFIIYTGGSTLKSNSTVLYQGRFNSINTTDKYLIHLMNDGTNGFFEAGYNTVQDFDNTTAFTYQAGSYNNVIGASTSTGGGNTYNSYIYEVIIFNSALSVADRRSICQYLTNKWSIANNAPRTDTYLYPFYNSRPFTRPFSPVDIDNCGLWLDAADSSSDSMTLSGSSVTVWKDKSGNGFNATSVGTANPTYSNNSIVSTGNSWFSTAYTSSVLNNETFFIVFNLSSLAADFSYVAGTVVPQKILYTPVANKSLYFGGIGSWASQSASNLLTTNVTYIAGFVVTQVSTTLSHSIYLNGIAVTNITGSPLFSGTPTTTILMQGLVGNVYEIISYSRALSTNERQQVESYLAQKWRLTNSLSGHLGKTGNYLSVDPRTVASNCALWLDASDTSSTSMTLSGSNVTVWKDKSGNGNATTTAYGPPTLTSNAINGLSAISVTTGKYFAMDPLVNPANQTTVTAFVVAVLNNVAYSYGRILSYGKLSDGTTNNDYSTVPNFIICRDNVNAGIFVYRNSAFSTSMPVTYASQFLVSCVFDGTNANSFMNGTSYNAFASTGTFSFNRLGIGFNINTKTDTADVFPGLIGEIIVYYSALTFSQRQTVEAYLAQKWGLTSSLPANHPAKLYKSLTVPFDPRSLPGCSLWLDAADSSSGSMTLSGSNVTTWKDKSGNAYNGSNNGTVTLSNFGSYQMVYFDGNSAIQGSYVNTGTTISVFCVYVPQGTIDNTRVVSMSRAVNVLDYTETASLGAIILDSTKAIKAPFTQRNLTAIYANTAYTLNGMNLASAIFDGTNGNILSQAQGAASAASTGSFNITLYSIACYAGYNPGSVVNKLTGYVGEVIVYNNALNTTNRQRVEGYLAHKWGLQSSLPSTHPYKKIRP